jgi:ankyrin repeat protein
MPKYWKFFNYVSSPYNLVHAAAENRDREIREMLADGVDPNAVGAVDLFNASALYWAARRGKLKAVAALLAGGADVDFGGPIKLTPFWQACRYGHFEVAQMLLDHGADINARNLTDNTALHIAAMDGKTDMVTFLLERGANPSLRDMAGKTARYYAVDKGCRKTINALLAHDKGKVLPPMSLHAPIRVKRLKLKSPETK